jgi:GntR family transcriptional regulator
MRAMTSNQANNANPTGAGSPGQPGAGDSVPAPAAPSPTFSPLYQQIKALITQSLESGEWKPGEIIPSEVELAARYKVSQGTVRKAIDELAAENLVVGGRARAPSLPPTTKIARSSAFCACSPTTAPSIRT